MRQIEQSCDLCDRESGFSVLAVRVPDGELMDDASYCRKHALEVALGLSVAWIRDSLSMIGRTRHQCYLDGCDCLHPSSSARPHCCQTEPSTRATAYPEGVPLEIRTRL